MLYYFISSCKLEKEEFTDSIVTNEVPLLVSASFDPLTQSPLFTVNNLYQGEMVTVLADSDPNCITGAPVAFAIATSTNIQLSSDHYPFINPVNHYRVRSVSIDGRYRCSDDIAVSAKLLLDVKQVATGYDFSCALKNNGETWCWGDNSKGQLGDGTTSSYSFPVQVTAVADQNITAIATGDYHTCALSSENKVFCWGDNSSGQLGDNSLSGVIAISSGGKHSCAILDNGSVKCWGENGSGQLGNNSTTNSSTPVAVSGLDGSSDSSTAVGISCGNNYTCAVLKDGKVNCWGENGSGQLGNNSTDNSTTPVEVSEISNATLVATGYQHSCAALSSGGLRCWGDNNWGSLGDGTTTDRHTPVEVANLAGEQIFKITLSKGYQYYSSSCALLESGAIKCWGSNIYGQLLDGSIVDSPTPVEATLVKDKTISSLSTNHMHICLTIDLENSSAVKCFGRRGTATGNGVVYKESSFKRVANITTSHLVTGIYVTGAFDGKELYLWGNGQHGQQLEFYEHRAIPHSYQFNSEIKELAFGFYYGCVLLSSGKVKCWGDNRYGQLGDGTTIERNHPVEVLSLADVKEISAGFYHICALINDGTIKCWGRNNYGQLGNGSTTDSLSPVKVSGIGDSDPKAVVISAGSYHTCALLDSGAVKCWGANSYGQLGDGTTTNHDTPTTVSGMDGQVGSDNVVTLSGHSIHQCALLNNGTVKCWGYNGSGQLGDGTTTNRSTPTLVDNLSGVHKLSSSLSNFALLTSGEVKVWGNNLYGQLGLGSSDNVLSPLTLNIEEEVIDVQTGGLHNCLLFKDGAIKCAGTNIYGQLGDGVPLLNGFVLE